MQKLNVPQFGLLQKFGYVESQNTCALGGGGWLLHILMPFTRNLTIHSRSWRGVLCNVPA